jgi:membrane protease YdiL (CAAX protease family)
MDDAFSPPDDDQPTIAATGEAAPEPLVACWRCHKLSPASAAYCPYCEATLAPPTLQERRANVSPITPVCVVFSLLLVVTLVQAGLMFFVDPDARNADVQRLQIMLVAEAIDTVVVISAWGLLRRRIHPLDAGLARPLITWAASPLLLAAALGVNFGYHALLRAYVNWPGEIDAGALPPPDLTLAILAVCIQPAIIEELFFRYLALGALRDSMNIHAAVFVSSVMFGVAHVGSPLSVPVLVLVGFMLGYMRVFSGGLALPMLVHFAHNAAILLAEHIFP